MRKRFLVALAVLSGLTTSFAANPFSDVEPNHWAYQSVAQLAAEGVINGYPDGTFKGENNITRYEMAQMVAKAMANQERFDAEQNAMINRLADEFSEELRNLGVRVEDLEKKVGNVKVTGDFRIAYEKEHGETQVSRMAWWRRSNEKYTFRARLNFAGAVNDKTTVNVRLATDDIEFGSEDNEIHLDQAYVTHRLGKNTLLNVGRQPLLIGGGLLADDNFDGVSLVTGDKTRLTAAYFVEDVGRYHEFGLLQADAKISNLNLGAFYLKLNEYGGVDMYGFNGALSWNKFSFGGEWTKVDKERDSEAWVAGLGYGDYDIKRKGSWDFKLNYFDVDYRSPVGDAYDTLYDDIGLRTGEKGWAISGRYALNKNTELFAAYSFDRESQWNRQIDDFYHVHIDYIF